MPVPRPDNYVLDAWALIAMIQGEEPAASRVAAILGEGEARRAALHMSWVNLGEIYYILGKRKGEQEAQETLDDIQQLPIRFHEPRQADILAAARNKTRFPISYADAFALSLAQSLSGSLITGDPELTALEGSVRIERLNRGP